MEEVMDEIVKQNFKDIGHKMIDAFAEQLIDPNQTEAYKIIQKLLYEIIGSSLEPMIKDVLDDVFKKLKEHNRPQILYHMVYYLLLKHKK